MRAIHAATATLGAGVLLMAVSWVWPWLIGDRMVWSEEQARNYSHAAAAVHAAGEAEMHRASGDPHARPDVSLAEARKNLEAAKTELESARNLRERLPGRLRWTGIVLAALGAAGCGVLRQE